jgi:hypothetical protein
MQTVDFAPEAATKTRPSSLIGQPVRICSGTLTGLSGTLTELRSSGRASIKLQEGVCLEIDQSCLDQEGTE